MSRIGKSPIPVPSGVDVSINGSNVTVKGPKGTLSRALIGGITVRQEENTLLVERPNDARESRSLHGLSRALVSNMVVGVTQGYEKKLEIQGVGYLATISNNVLSLRVGFANELKKQIPSDLKVNCPDQTHIVIRGCDKQRVGQFAAEVRALRKPEPYKGKGIRYQGEQIKLKPGKSATK